MATTFSAMQTTMQKSIRSSNACATQVFWERIEYIYTTDEIVVLVMHACVKRSYYNHDTIKICEIGHNVDFPNNLRMGELEI